ncbi:MAG: aspartate-semialdehyde dehydrogenase, partial [Dehalococcoidia bacterium]|nr:aspartate-semialdehyde dehydrogenase [Dehalococcoidia bacterium]
QGTDLAFFSAGTEISQYAAPQAVREGAVVVDNSAAFRMEPRVPLVVPEVNPQDIRHHSGIIANPNCSTIQMVVALNPLHKVNPIRRIIVDTYQSVSGTGREAVEELSNQTKAVLEGHNVIPHVYPHQIGFNLLPEIDVFLDNGYTKEELKMIQETRKIMHAPEIAISATCVRVPIYIAHSEAIHVEFTRPMSAVEARQILSEAPGVKVQDDPDVSLYPHPWAVAGNDDVYVGRIREDASHPNGLVMWVVADNVRKGAALNGIQIAEYMIQNGLLCSH